MSHVQNLSGELAQGGLRAFERRLKEIIACYEPQERRWRCVLAIAVIFTTIGVWCWATDPEIAHPFFTLYITMLVVLYAYGIHEKCLASQHIANQARLVLLTYDMTCNNRGKLMLLHKNWRASSSSSSSSDSEE